MEAALLLACVMPIVVCLAVLWTLHTEPSEAKLNELLIQELLTSESPVSETGPLLEVPHDDHADAATRLIKSPE